ncbi:MAG: hypothetical protein Q8P34_17635 [Bacteroidota bacterium]|nr:hypothetical protein [Bacteroidota bacterium]
MKRKRGVHGFEFTIQFIVEPVLEILKLSPNAGSSAIWQMSHCSFGYAQKFAVAGADLQSSLFQPGIFNPKNNS